MVEKILSVTSVVAGLVFLYFITNLFFSKIIHEKINKRSETIIMLIINLLKYVSTIIGLLVILNIFGVDTASILAGAGLIGILLGFALQKMLQDMINGFFIIIENQYIVGEYVEIKGRSGRVLELGLKTTKILTYTGEVIVFSNGEINQISNFSRYDSLMIIDLVILNENEFDIIVKIIEDVINNFRHHNIKGKMKIIGIQEMNEVSYSVRIVAETNPYTYFEVARLAKVEIIKNLQKNKVTFIKCMIINPKH
jgi:small conductance mechanosensitive channel